MKSLPLTFALLLMISISYGQSTTSKKLKVFIDCSNMWCDDNFIRTEINVVDFMLDRIAADVHVLMTSQRNGNGARAVQVIFYGQGKYIQYIDTLKFENDPNATDFEERDNLVHHMKIGLAPLIVKSGFGDQITISTKADKTESDEIEEPVEDPWNYWVFRVGGNGSLNADQVYKSYNLNSFFSINRITDDVKFRLRLNGGTNVSTYEYEDNGELIEIVVQNESYEINNILAKSINDHWTYGYETEWNSSTFSNIKSTFFFLPQLEYSFFPYKEVNNKYLTLRYGAGIQHNQYYDTTLYDKTKEMLWGQNLELTLAYNQKWGSVSSSIEYRNYFHDWKVNNLGIELQTEIRITGGLSFYVFLFGGIVHDQIYLPKAGASGEEVLTRQRQLATNFRYDAYFGLNYRFGSKLNNFVNPRFTGPN